MEAATAGAISDAIRAGKTALSGDSRLVSENDLVDVVIDATGKPAVGAEIGLSAMEAGKVVRVSDGGKTCRAIATGIDGKGFVRVILTQPTAACTQQQG